MVEIAKKNLIMKMGIQYTQNNERFAKRIGTFTVFQVGLQSAQRHE